ncbi:MAG: hypothetical protein ACI3Z5_05790 [Paludibacteraceae bacterium]
MKRYALVEYVQNLENFNAEQELLKWLSRIWVKLLFRHLFPKKIPWFVNEEVLHTVPRFYYILLTPVVGTATGIQNKLFYG